MCFILSYRLSFFFFFFNDTATTEIYTLSLHDALPICFLFLVIHLHRQAQCPVEGVQTGLRVAALDVDRKSTRLNSSHSQISYAVFCLKKKKKPETMPETNYCKFHSHHSIRDVRILSTA